jgi:hypothetical protein
MSFGLVIILASLLGQPLGAQVAAPSDQELGVESRPSGELKTVAVVAVAHYEKLISDITLLGSLIGRAEAGQMVEGGFAFFTQGKGPAALDKKQPWGVIVQTDGAAFMPVGCLPVAKADDVLEVARAYGVQVNNAEDGVKELVLPNQQSVFLKQEAGWTFISLSPDALSRAPEDPQAILAELVTEYDIAARIAMKDVPEMYRQFAVQAMQAGVQQGMTRQADETEGQHELRRAMAEARIEQLSRLVNDLDLISLGWTIDAEQKRTYLDVTPVFKRGSKSAQEVASYGQSRTNFAGFYQPDAAITAIFVYPKLIAGDVEYVEMMRNTRRLINKVIDKEVRVADAASAEAPEELKAAIGDFLDAFADTLKTGRMDGASTFHFSPDSMTLLMAISARDPAKVEAGLRKLEAAGKKLGALRERVQWNAASHAGVNFHTLAVPVPEDEKDARRWMGSELNIAVGLGPKAVYLAIGKDNLDAVKHAIDASAAETDKAAPPFDVAISLGRIMEMAVVQAKKNDQKAIAQKVADMLRKEAPDRDHIRAVGEVIPNGMRYRVVAEEGVLRAVGAAVTEAQRQALQASQ